MSKIKIIEFAIIIVLLVTAFYYHQQTVTLVALEKDRLQDAYYNLNYEISAHEEDVYLLKKENYALHQQCGIP